jgi:small redox-active disulfide protein 2
MSVSRRKIEVLGPGCSRCRETYRVVQEVAQNAGLDVEVVKEESYERMTMLGLLATPGIAIDGKVVMSGRIPRPEEVRQLLGIA